MKSIAILLEGITDTDYPFSNPYFYESYKDFTSYAAGQGVTVYIIRESDEYLGNMRFASGWKFEGEHQVKIEHEIEVDILYRKRRVLNAPKGSKQILVNSSELERVANNKWETYQLIGEFMKPTFQINNGNWQEVVKAISTDKIVLKPIFGYGGRGVIIVDKQGFDFTALDINEPYIAQDFIDSSNGIPNITEGNHDFRLLLFNDEVPLSFLRTPKEGSLLANVTLGGRIDVIDIVDAPSEAVDIAKKVAIKLTKMRPVFCTVDFMFENGKPFVVELNSQPGFPQAIYNSPKYNKEFYKHLLSFLKEAAQSEVPSEE